jgi:hypothetical protein
VETEKLTLEGDSDGGLGSTAVTTLPPNPCACWERPLLHDSNNAPAKRMAIMSANRRLSGSHLSSHINAPRSMPRVLVGQALRFSGLRTFPANPGFPHL